MLEVLPALTARPDLIKQMRQAILNLAIRGKLVPQNPKDEPAIKFDPAIPADLKPSFDIPKTWSWARLRALGKLKGGGTPSKTREDFWNGSIPWVSPKDMKIDYLAAAQMNISNAAVAGSAASLIDAGSILFVVRGMILAHSFPVAVARVQLTVNQDMKALVLQKPEMAEFILRALKGLKPEMLKRVQRSSHGTCRLEGSDYGDFLIPIPPLAEQHRIVAKIDELMALCDQLEASLESASTTRGRLLEALIAEALAPAEDLIVRAA
jgi:type I restriction enzyme S subunit